jgi:hypothetical protein
MTYTIVTKLIPHDRSLVFENTSDWEAAMDFSCEEMVSVIPGMTSCTLELQDDKKTVIRTMVYESVDARLAHREDRTLPTGKRLDYFLNEFISESEPVPNLTYTP